MPATLEAIPPDRALQSSSAHAPADMDKLIRLFQRRIEDHGIRSFRGDVAGGPQGYPYRGHQHGRRVIDPVAHKQCLVPLGCRRDHATFSSGLLPKCASSIPARLAKKRTSSSRSPEQQNSLRTWRQMRNERTASSRANFSTRRKTERRGPAPYRESGGHRPGVHRCRPGTPGRLWAAARSSGLPTPSHVPTRRKTQRLGPVDTPA